MVLHRSWIMEWAELDHITNKRHAGQVKAFSHNRPTCFGCRMAKPPSIPASRHHRRLNKQD